ncbi:hypothetical protein AYI69_g1923, partial [Smittium culicis]
MKTLEILAYFIVCFKIAVSSGLGSNELKDISADSLKDNLKNQIGDLKILNKNKNALQSIFEQKNLVDKLGNYDKPEINCCFRRGGFGGFRHICRPVVHRHICRPVVHRHICRPFVHRHICRPVVHRHICRPVVHRHVCRPFVHRHICRPFVHRHICRPVVHRHICRPVVHR